MSSEALATALRAEPAERVLEVSGVVKEYWLSRAPLHVLMESLGGRLGERLSRALPGAAPLRAVDEVSLHVERGEIVGVIGKNGAGKSTLLKLVAGLVAPTRGHVRRRGRVASLLELGASFHPELSGRDNVHLACALRGLDAHETRRRMDDILRFADIGAFIDQPVRHYSSGMVVRLGFAIAIHSDPDLVLLDEVLAVGDVAFQAKCISAVEALRARGAGFLLVSHNLFQVSQLCRRAVVLHEGRVVFAGEAAAAVRHLEETLLGGEGGSTHGGELLSASDVVLTSQAGAGATDFAQGDLLTVEFTLTPRTPLDDVVVIVGITRSDQVIACNFNSELDGFGLGRLEKPTRLRVRLPPLKLTADAYRLGLYVWKRGYAMQYLARDYLRFSVRDPFLRRHSGIFHEAAAWERLP